MSPPTLELRRRRWTLVFSAPFTAVLAALGAYSISIMLGGDRMSVLVGGCGAFVSFCVAGTVGKSAFEAWRDTTPAVIVDQRGLTDFRGSTGLVRWHDIETFKLDDDEQKICVNMRRSAARSAEVRTKARRLFADADHVIALGGLQYDSRELAKALAEHHRQAKPGSPFRRRLQQAQPRPPTIAGE